MPKFYYKCSKCHMKNSRVLEANENTYTACSRCKEITKVYLCQHNYWWERIYLTIRDIIRNIKNDGEKEN